MIISVRFQIFVQLTLKSSNIISPDTELMDSESKDHPHHTLQQVRLEDHCDVSVCSFLIPSHFELGSQHGDSRQSQQ